MQKWVHIGFGRIGRGLVTQALHDVKTLDYYVIDQNLQPGVINYSLNVGNHTELIKDIKVTKFELLDKDEFIIFSTSVIVSNLQSVIDTIKRNGFKKFVIVPFENSTEAFKILEDNNVPYFKTVVDRIVFGKTIEDMFVESFSNIKIDKSILAVVDLPEKMISQNIDKEHEMKFYLVNGLHAALAYIVESQDGKTIGEYFVKELFKDEIISCFVKYLTEHNISKENQIREYLGKSFARFKASGEDTIERIGRNPQLKKSRGERLEPIWQYGSKELKDTIFK